MAEATFLFLKANGNDVAGESSQTSLGRENSIECIKFDHSVRTAREAGSGMATGRRTYEPIKITKRIDKATPLIAKAMSNNETIDGSFKFYRPNPTGDGTTEQFFTVDIKNGRVAAIEWDVEDVLDPASSTRPATETVSFVFHEITWTYTNGGITHVDSWGKNQ